MKVTVALVQGDFQRILRSIIGCQHPNRTNQLHEWTYILAIHSFHDLFGRLAQGLSDKRKLVHMVFSREERLSWHHFRQNAPDTPDIYSIAIFLPCQHDLRCSIVSCCDIACHLVVLLSSQSEIADFQITIFVDQEIAGFKVTVNHPGWMKIFQSTLDQSVKSSLTHHRWTY